MTVSGLPLFRPGIRGLTIGANDQRSDIAGADEEPGDEENLAKSALAIGGLTTVILVALAALFSLLCLVPCMWYRILLPDMPFN